MIWMKNWTADIPEEERHIAFVGENETGEKTFFLPEPSYGGYSFYLDVAFDLSTVTTEGSHDNVEVSESTTEVITTSQTTINTTHSQNTYHVKDKTVDCNNKTDVVPLVKTVKSDGVELTWRILAQHTRLPGKLLATLRAVGANGEIKKSAIMCFTVDPSVSAVPAVPVTLAEWEVAESQLAEDVAEMKAELETIQTSVNNKVDSLVGLNPASKPTATPTAGNLASLDADGNLEDSGKKASDFADGNAFQYDAEDKVAVVTVDNVEALTVQKNLVFSKSGFAVMDTGAGITISKSTVAPVTGEENASLGTANKPWGHIYGKGDGLTDVPKSALASGVQASLGLADTALQSHQDISGKADKVSGATNGNFAGLDANGNLTDSGKKAGDFAKAENFIVSNGTKIKADDDVHGITLLSDAGNDIVYISNGGDILPTAGTPQLGALQNPWGHIYGKGDGLTDVPKSALASGVQASLGLADTAVQPKEEFVFEYTVPEDIATIGFTISETVNGQTVTVPLCQNILILMETGKVAFSPVTGEVQVLYGDGATELFRFTSTGIKSTETRYLRVDGTYRFGGWSFSGANCPAKSAFGASQLLQRQDLVLNGQKTISKLYFDAKNGALFKAGDKVTVCGYRG